MFVFFLIKIVISGKQILPSCFWWNVCHIKSSGQVYFNKQASLSPCHPLSACNMPQHKWLDWVYQICRSILRSYAHDDVTAGSWFVGLDVAYIDEGKFCCSSWAAGLSLSNITNHMRNRSSQPQNFNIKQKIRSLRQVDLLSPPSPGAICAGVWLICLKIVDGKWKYKPEENT